MRRAHRFGWVLFTVFLSVQTVVAQSNLEDQLRATLIGKTLALKSACPSNRLTFDTKGALTRGCSPGAWIVYSLFRPDER
jgi:hypothetical protein